MANHDFEYNRKRGGKKGDRRKKGQSSLALILWRIKHTLVLLAFTVMMIGIMLAVLVIFVARIRASGL